MPAPGGRSAVADTSADAWGQAVEQARALGMLRRQSVRTPHWKTLASWRCRPHNGRFSPFFFGVSIMRHTVLALVLFLLLAPFGCKGKTENGTNVGSKPNDATGKNAASISKPGDGIATAKEAEDKSATFVEKLGGKVIRDTGSQGNPVVRVELGGKQLNDAGLKEMAGLKNLLNLYLPGTDISDAGMKELAGFNQLQLLHLSRTKIGDAGLKELANLKQLRSLNVENTQVTKEGVAEFLKALPKCKVYHTAGSQGGGKDKENPLLAGMQFVKVPKGNFWMSKDEKNAQVQVEIKEDFELAAYTVTQEQWEAVMGNNPSWFSRKGTGKDTVKDISDTDLKRFPVEQVSWNDVQEFLKKLNEQQKGKGWLYHLPTEAEWEYACRNAATTKEDCSFDFYFDKPTNDLSSKQANFDGEHPAGKAEKGVWLRRPTKVGSYAPNKLGLYDMHGNVWQWCSDLYGEPGSDRVVRGGNYLTSAQSCRAADQMGRKPSERYRAIGFRLARVPSGDKQ
jgi:formylglycine-generating enzyme required for sulfatase activity